MLRLTTTAEPAALRSLRTKLAGKESLLAPLAAPALEAVRKNFAAGGRPTPWAPLKGGGRADLTQTGRLMASIRARVEGGRLILSTSLPYAAVHQFGGRHTPARPFLVLPPEEVSRLAGQLRAQLSGARP